MDKILERLDIETLIKSVNNGVYCGAECQKKKEETRLREKVNKTALNVKTAPEKYENAQANYIKFIHGDERYEVYKDKIAQDKIMKTLKPSLNDIKKNLNTLNEIKRNNKYLNQTVHILENNTKNENEKINNATRELNDLETNVNTTKQKTKYQHENQTFLKSVYSFNNVLFYILYVVSVLFYYSRFGIPTIKMTIVFSILLLYNFAVDRYTIINI